MDNSDTPPPSPRLLLPLRRRKSISTKTRHSFSFPLQHNSASADTPRLRPPHLDLDLLSLKSSESYTSLKDLLPSSPSFAAAQSPTPNSAATSQISIRNRLVKQAAWAYLQPMSASSGPSGPHLLQRLWLHCSSFLARFFPCFSLSS